MSRWNSNMDDPVAEDGDRFFIGLNSKANNAILPEGFVSGSINKRFTNQTAETRKGTIMPAGNRFWTAADAKFLGSFVYQNPNGQERLIFAPAGPIGTQGINSYDLENDNYVTIDLPPGVLIPPTALVWFAQGFDKLIMLVVGLTHGSLGNHFTNGLVWDGNDAHIFEWFTWGGDPDLEVIPPSVWAWPISNRIAYVANFLYAPPFANTGAVFDHILFSDILDYQNMDPVLGDFRINTGEADHIVSLIPYAYDTLVIFMSRSIHLLSNFSVDFTLATQEVITAYQGSGSIRSPIQVGQEIFFMSEKLGVFRLSEVLEKRLSAHPLPISDPIQPIIDRINWPFQDKICAQTQDNYVFFAVPLDNSPLCNAILVYNTTTKNWETIDQFDIPNFAIDNMLATHIGGVRRIVAVQNGPPALIYLLYEGDKDQTVFDLNTPQFTPISDMIETRGYGLSQDSGPVGFRNFQRGGVVMETVNPNVKITAVSEGVNEEKVLRDSITKDSSKFYVHGKTGTFPRLEPKREDYDFGMNFDAQDFSQMPVGDIPSERIPPMKNLEGEEAPAQASRERFAIRVTDRWLSLRIENSQGSCNVVSTSVESIESKRGARVAA